MLESNHQKPVKIIATMVGKLFTEIPLDPNLTSTELTKIQTQLAQLASPTTRVWIECLDEDGKTIDYFIGLT